MPTIEFKGRQIEVDEEGYLLNHADWTNDLMIQLANEEGLYPENLDCELINIAQKSYLQSEKPSPDPKEYLIMIGEITKIILTMKNIQKFFPDGFSQICKIAGLPKPTN